MNNAEIKEAPAAPTADASADVHVDAEISADAEQSDNPIVTDVQQKSNQNQPSYSAKPAYGCAVSSNFVDVTRDIDFVRRKALRICLDDINNKTSISSLDDIRYTVLHQIRDLFLRHNNLQKDRRLKWSIPQTLNHADIAYIMSRIYNVKCIARGGLKEPRKLDTLAVYQDTGYDKGLYVDAEDSMRGIMQELKPSITEKEIKEILHSLRINNTIERVVETRDKDLIPVNNGVFDYKTKKLLPFSPDYVFMTKCNVDYNPNATNVTLRNPDDTEDWNVEDWIDTLSDDPEVRALLWELIGACVRFNVSWKKTAFFYSVVGNNGKGTFCELLRAIVGRHTSIEMADFNSKDNPFLLESLVDKTAIITDENDVDMHLDKIAKLKAIVTNDPIMINRKFQTTVIFTFHGMMIQCVNGIPKVKDKSGSFYRRLLVIPFTKSFKTDERICIKDEYVKNNDVLEYVLYRVLHTDFYELSEPKACVAALEEYKLDNDYTRQFWTKFRERFVWELLPYGFLYELYKSWMKKSNPTEEPLGERKFNSALRDIIAEMDSDNWECTGDGTAPALLIHGTELLIYEYKLPEPWWRTDTSQKHGQQNVVPAYVSTPTPTSLSALTYRGFRRI